MKQRINLVFYLFSLLLSGSLEAQTVYFPPANTDWEERSPSSLDLNGKALAEAVDFALENEYSGSRDLRIAILKGFAHEPYHKILGPTKKREDLRV